MRREASKADREIVERAANREFQILDTLQHPGIIRSYDLVEHELGPALSLEHDPTEIRLDHYLAQRQESLSVDARLDLMRQIAEVISFTHEKRTIHCNLSPRSILVTETSSWSSQDQGLQLAIGLSGGVCVCGSNQGGDRHFPCRSAFGR